MNLRSVLAPRSARHATAWLLIAIAVAAHGATTPVDDSGTVVMTPTVKMGWQTQLPRGRASALMTGSTPVRVRLNVTPWLRHSGRIYLLLPAQPPGSVHASWTTQGRLLPGQVVSGTRALVYSGPITTPFIEDLLQLEILVDGKQMNQTYNINFRFEMDSP
jgi:hypothetical protein